MLAAMGGDSKRHDALRLVKALVDAGAATETKDKVHHSLVSAPCLLDSPICHCRSLSSWWAHLASRVALQNGKTALMFARPADKSTDSVHWTTFNLLDAIAKVHALRTRPATHHQGLLHRVPTCLAHHGIPRPLRLSFN